MTKSVAGLLSALLLAAAPLAAQAQVRYSFEAFSAFDPNVVGSFWFETGSFIQADLQVDADQLGGCSVMQPEGASCLSVVFKVDTTEYHGGGSGDIDDAVNFQVSGTGPVYYFQNGALGAVGTYDSILFGADQQARLTVSQVPEAGTVAMALGGLALLGLVCARRRNAG